MATIAVAHMATTVAAPMAIKKKLKIQKENV